MIGQKLNKRYKITAQLGKGAMGKVYRATDTLTRQQVAIKVIASELVIDPAMLERFKREGEALRRLKHPNIVGFLDAFYYHENYVIVMEYISGGSLYELIKRGSLSLVRTQQIGLDLCDALIRAHRLNIIHRDIKPENILLDEDGTPKLADFGVARISAGTRMTRTGTQVGTPYYMAPEAWEGKPLDAQADIWSLGVVLFEMLTGQVPFDGDTGPVVMTKVFTTQPPDMNNLRADLPPDLVKIITRMLTREKVERYRTMREVAVDLERVQLPAEENREFAGKATRIIPEHETTEKPEKEVAESERLQAEEQARQIVVREKTERDAAARDKAEKTRREKKEDKPNVSRPKAGSQIAYWLGGFAVLILGIVLLSSLNNPSQSPEPTPENTQSQIIPASTFTETTEPNSTPTSETTSTPASTLTPTPLPTEIMDAKGVSMVLVPAGEFMMGSDSDHVEALCQQYFPSESGCHSWLSDAGPSNQIYLNSFYIDKFEVTNAHYASCVHATICQLPLSIRSNAVQNYYGDSKYDNYPVVFINWNMASAYCEWRGGRLPTESEWEKAARGENGFIWPWGNELDYTGCSKGNYGNCSNDLYNVNAFEDGISPYGIFNTFGNASEWVSDWHDTKYYEDMSLSNPLGPAFGVSRVTRGGSYKSSNSPFQTLWDRTWHEPHVAYEDLGFRCARDANP